MRSEKEVRQRIKEYRNSDEPFDDIEGVSPIEELEWVLEGQSSYSMKDLEKLSDWMLEQDEMSPEIPTSEAGFDFERIFNWFKENPKLIKKILEEENGKD